MAEPNVVRDRSADRLGPLVRTWRPRATGIFNSVDLANGCIAVLGAWLVIGLVWVGLYVLLGSVSAFANLTAILAVGLAVLSVIAWVRWARGFVRVSVDQHAGGLVVTRRDKRHVIAWNEIEAFRWVPVTTRGAAALGSSIRTVDGTTVDLPSLIADATELGRLVESHVYDRRMPAALEAFRRGETLDFGAFSSQVVRISQREITLGKRAFAWPDVIKVGLEGGVIPTLAVSWAGGRFRNQSTVPLVQVENVAVLLGLVSTITDVAVG
jgi:hypothetical protein